MDSLNPKKCSSQFKAPEDMLNGGQGPHWSQGSWGSYGGPCRFCFALLDLAGSRAAVPDETACLGDVHPAVLAQRLAAV